MHRMKGHANGSRRHAAEDTLNKSHRYAKGTSICKGDMTLSLTVTLSQRESSTCAGDRSLCQRFSEASGCSADSVVTGALAQRGTAYAGSGQTSRSVSAKASGCKTLTQGQADLPKGPRPMVPPPPSKGAISMAWSCRENQRRECL